MVGFFLEVLLEKGSSEPFWLKNKRLSRSNNQKVISETENCTCTYVKIKKEPNGDEDGLYLSLHIHISNRSSAAVFIRWVTLSRNSEKRESSETMELCLTKRIGGVEFGMQVGLL
ncbi:hypothetical protein MRB53_029162 [Persea americana]|uniref:Uncharacterized protein n=1 Tax=Persea americana TaxID=3435 RepID=A0ACC2KHR9_PERAE|nr:hypothetical protein MRB53_029162 [Persea americana]